MTGEAQETIQGEGKYRDAGWELPEIAPIAILVSLGFTFIGAVLFGILTLVSQEGFEGDLGWGVVEGALRWVDPTTAGMLLAALAICWWQYGQWSGDRVRQGEALAAVAHADRVFKITKWLRGGFVISIVSVIVLVIASFGNGQFPHTTVGFWGDIVEEICDCLGVLVISGLGIVAAGRILGASGPNDRALDAGDA
jgi:hypothetical protein